MCNFKGELVSGDFRVVTPGEDSSEIRSAIKAQQFKKKIQTTMNPVIKKIN